MKNKDFLIKLEKTKQTILANYNLLLRYQQLEVESSTMESTLIIQKESIIRLFENLEQKLKVIIADYGPFSNKCWDNHTDNWKDLSFINSELKKTKQTILDNYNLLLKNQQLGVKLSTLERILITQEENTIKLFENLEQKLKVILDNEDMPLTKEWWNNLSDIWKDFILINVELGAKINYSIVDRPILSLELYFHKLVIEYFIKPEIGNYESILTRIFHMEQLYLDYFSAEKIDSLNPLSYLTNLTSLYIQNNSTDLFPISKLNNLTELNLWGNKADISPITNLLALKTLYITGNEIDLSIIGNLTKLEKLDWQGTRIDLNPLANLSNLTDLSLPFNEADLSPISNLTNLNKIDLKGNKADLNPIAKLTNLQSLDLEGNEAALCSISNLTNLTSLILGSEVTFIRTKQLYDRYGKYDHIHEINLNFITNLTKLKSLIINGDKSDLEPIANLLNLEKLDLRNHEADISPIANLINLKEFHINSYRLLDLSPIANLVNLKKLIFYSEKGGNKADLTPLANLNNLTHLNLLRNESDLTPLANLNNLTHLDLRYNIADPSPIAKLTNLQELKITVYDEYLDAYDTIIESMVTNGVDVQW